MITIAELKPLNDYYQIVYVQVLETDIIPEAKESGNTVILISFAVWSYVASYITAYDLYVKNTHAIDNINDIEIQRKYEVGNKFEILNDILDQYVSMKIDLSWNYHMYRALSISEKIDKGLDLSLIDNYEIQFQYEESRHYLDTLFPIVETIYNLKEFIYGTEDIVEIQNKKKEAETIIAGILEKV